MATAKKAKTVENHEVIPLHEKLSDGEKEKLLVELNVAFKDLPKIFINDSAVVNMDVKLGDIIKVTRKSGTSKVATFYRGVIDA